MMIANQAHWSLGVIIGVPFLALGLLVCALLIVGAYRVDDEDLSPMMLGLGGVGGVVLLVIAVLSYYPFNAQYHKWYDVTGTVEATNKRLISDGKSMSERFVIKFKESPTLYGCDDTRCSLATAGKPLTLACKRQYVFNSTSGWVCNYKQEG